MEQLPDNMNPERRRFLKTLLISGGGFLLGWLFRPFTKLFLSGGSSFEVDSKPPDASQKQASEPAPEMNLGEETDFKNFRVIEKKNSMTFIDKKTNEEVLILD